ncbi:MAG: radical SAM family heme chaperone HemW [Ruminococcaceae bacterium]|nr:radical SAM family heme chaperone HemW [Oscillospiraceae bacterium]
MKPLGIYIHIPFCKNRCAYCDFHSNKVTSQKYMADYTKLLCQHITEGALKDSDYEVDTLYFGGGTPTWIGAKNLVRIAKTVYKCFKVLNDCETTLEANPDTVDLKLLKKLRKVGFNRISFGMQSSNPMELADLGRTHSFEQVKDAVAIARKAKFDNISVDLMYGIPSQTEQTWKKTLEDAISLDVEHISCYALKLEEGTRLYDHKEDFLFPDDDTVADLYLYAVERLEAAGYKQYEVSNFARPGRQSKHNYKYWNLGEYWGVGPSAYSFLSRMRFSYVAHTDRYMQAVKNGDTVIQNSEKAEGIERAGEYLMLMLRTTEGISRSILEKKYLIGFDKIESCLQKYEADGYAMFTDGSWRLTPKGFLISNTIISDILIALEQSEHLTSSHFNKIRR